MDIDFEECIRLEGGRADLFASFPEAYALGRWSRFVPRGPLFLGKCEKGRGPCGKCSRLVLVPSFRDSIALLLWEKALSPVTASVGYGVMVQWCTDSVSL